MKFLQVLIDTWWNVNDGSDTLSNILSTVLIDTWWNVNALPLKGSYSFAVVLIDTWWNVNVFILYIITRRK